MGVEIERKFLLDRRRLARAWQAGAAAPGLPVVDARARTVRVRIEGGQGMLDHQGQAARRHAREWEYPIPLQDAATNCSTPVRTAAGRKIPHAAFAIQVPHLGSRRIPRCEPGTWWSRRSNWQSEDEAFDKPDWIGAGSHRRRRYFNSSLIKLPYSRWFCPSKSACS
jgi:adenylate cyclase